MKKYIILLLLATVSFTFTACDNETELAVLAVEKMAEHGITWEQKMLKENGKMYCYGGIEHLILLLMFLPKCG